MATSEARAGGGVVDVAEFIDGLDRQVRGRIFAQIDLTKIAHLCFVFNPPAFVAFQSTLEVVKESDLLVHVVDSAASDPSEQIDAVRAVLAEIGAHRVPELLAFNKPSGLSSQGGRAQVNTLDELLWAFAKPGTASPLASSYNFSEIARSTRSG